MESKEIIRLQEDLKYWENAFLRLQEQHRVIQKLFYELQGKQEEKKPNIEDADKEEIHILLDVEHLKAIKSYAEHMESGIVGDIWGNAYRGLILAVKMIKLFPKTSWEDIETPKITLSDKIYAEDYAEEVNIGRLFKFDDVKDFIKTIKHKIYIGSIVRGDITRENAIKIIDDEAGDKLK